MAAEIWAAMIGLAILAPAVWLSNRLVADRNLVRQGYADIDVQLKRRADLVPPLVEAVRAYAAHERALLTSVAELRAAAIAAPAGTERFAVEAEGREIRRGILRDFPTDYRDRFGNRVSVPFEVVEVKRNGSREP